MTTTYSGDPSTSTRDAVRFLIHDVGPTTWLLTDQEIDYLVAETATARSAARSACETLAARFTGQATTTKKVGDLSLTRSFSEAAQEYRDLAASLAAADARTNPPVPLAHPNSLVPTAHRSTSAAEAGDFYTGIHDNRRGSGSVDGYRGVVDPATGEDYIGSWPVDGGTL